MGKNKGKKNARTEARARAHSPIVEMAPQVTITHRDGVTHLTPNPNAETPKSSSSAGNVDLMRPSAKELMDREQALIDALLVRFKNIVELAAQPEQDVSKEVAAAQVFQIKVETAALIRAAEDLLKLTRELKELWLVGPIRGVGEGQDESKIDEDAKVVGQLVQHMIDLQTQAEKKAVLLEEIAKEKDAAEQAAKKIESQLEK